MGDRRQGVEVRLRSGKVLVVCGTVLLVAWVYYFAGLLQGPIWYFDFIPLPVALALIALGVKLSPGFVSARLSRVDDVVRPAVWWKGDLVLAIVIAGLAEVAIWFFFNYVVGHDIDLLERYDWINRLQRPGEWVGLRVWRQLTWHRRGDLSLYRYAALTCAYVVLIAMWSSAAFGLLTVARFWRRRVIDRRGGIDYIQPCG